MIKHVIEMLIVTIIISLVVGRLREQSASYKESTDEFDVFTSNDYIKILYIGVLFCFGCAIGAAYAYSEDPTNMSAAMSLTFIGTIIAILIPLAKQRISVRGNKIYVKKMFSTKTYDFNDITHYSGTDVTTVYSGKNALFIFDIDCIGAKNMLDRLKMEGVTKTEAILQDSGGIIPEKVHIDVTDRPIRKEDVLSLKNNSNIIALAILFLVLIIAGMFMSPVFGLIMIIPLAPVLLFMYLAGPVKYYSIMLNMEKALGIDINAEMERLGFCDFRSGNDDWYLSNENPYKLILHRDYISEVLQITERDAGWWIISFMAVDGRTVRFQVTDRKAFVKWYGFSKEEACRLSEARWYRQAWHEDELDIPDEKPSGVEIDYEEPSDIVISYESENTED